MGKQLHTITGAVIATGRSSDTLRRWEKAGIVQPVRDTAGRRLYTDQDLQRIRDHIRQRRQRAPAAADR